MKERRNYVRYKFDVFKSNTLYGTKGTMIEFEEQNIKISGTESMYVVNTDGTLSELVKSPFVEYINITEVIDNLDLTDDFHYTFAVNELYKEIKEHLSYARYDIGGDITFTDWYEEFVTRVEDLENSDVLKLDVMAIAYHLLHNVIKITETYYE